jgi:hypothetical protein
VFPISCETTIGFIDINDRCQRHHQQGRGFSMSNRKRLARIVVGITLAAGAASVASAGIAAADPQGDYLYDVNNAGIGGPKNTLLQLGYGACTEVRQNLPRSASIANISGSTSLASDDATFLYDSAIQFLCP